METVGKHRSLYDKAPAPETWKVCEGHARRAVYNTHIHSLPNSVCSQNSESVILYAFFLGSGALCLSSDPEDNVTGLEERSVSACSRGGKVHTCFCLCAGIKSLTSGDGLRYSGVSSN